MRLNKQQQHWDRWGTEDPLWAILTVPGRERGGWDLDEFLASGVEEVDGAVAQMVSTDRGRALDFGCGVGRCTLHLASLFEKVDGVDIAPSMIGRGRELARERKVQNVSYHVNGRDDLRLFPSESFDLVYANIVLQHMETRYGHAYISEFVRVLRQSGTLIFQVPTAHPPAEGPAMARAKARARRNAPERVVAAYDALSRLVRRPTTPAMEMHVYAEEHVAQTVAAAGGTVVNALPDTYLDQRWRSRRFIVTKR